MDFHIACCGQKDLEAMKPGRKEGGRPAMGCTMTLTQQWSHLTKKHGLSETLSKRFATADSGSASHFVLKEPALGVGRGCSAWLPLCGSQPQLGPCIQ